MSFSKCSLILLLVLCANLAFADEPADNGLVRGPDAVESLLDEQSEATGCFSEKDWLEKWKQFKGGLEDSVGLSLAGDYNSLVFGSTASLGSRSAAGGVARLYGQWTFLGRGTEDTGGLVFKVEHRHRYGSVAPSAFGPELGYLGAPQTTFNNDGFRTTTLYWRQSFAEQRFVVYTGFLDVTDFLDIYPMASPWNGFNNLAFATGSGSIGGLPDGALGVLGAAWLTDSIYIISSLTDANARATDITDGFDTFFNEFETFKTCELYWIPDKAVALFNKVNTAVWQIDEATAKDTPDGWGISGSASVSVGDRCFFFLRGGWADDGGSLYDRSVTVGFGHQVTPNEDLFGFGLNWSRPNPGTFGENQGDQYTSELFYRWQATANVQLTPSVQLLVDPAMNPTTDLIAVFGLRGQIEF